MNKREFNKQYAAFKVNGPSYKGAAMPSAEPNMVNECNFPHELRYKSYNIDYDDIAIVINWESQEWNENVHELVKEIMRYYDYIADRVALEEDIEVIINISDRDECFSRCFTETIHKVGEN